MINATISDRMIKLTTSYGSSSSTRDATNTLRVVVTVGTITTPVGNAASRVATREPPEFFSGNISSAIKIGQLYGVTGRKQDAAILAISLPLSTRSIATFVDVLSKNRIVASVKRLDASRGPPEAA